MALGETLSPQRSRVPAQTLIMTVFALQPVAFGAWLPRIPDMRAALDLTPALLALCLLGLPVGILSMLPFAGRFVARIGARRVLIGGFVVFLAVMPLAAFASSALQLFLGLMAAGVAMSVLELALNISADRLERHSGRLIMNTCHGCWSLGIMAGSLIGSGLAGLGLSPALSGSLVAAAIVPLALLAAVALPALPAPPVTQPARPGPTRKAMGMDIIGLGLFVIGIAMTEGAIADWSALYLRDVFTADSAAAGLGYAGFAALVTCGRLGGDRLKAAIGTLPLARLCGGAALLGLGLVVAAPVAALAYLGFAVTGFGVSVGFPLAVSAAAALPGRLPEKTVAALSFMALLGFLIGPVLIGTLADLAGLRIGLAGLLPILALSFAYIPALSPRP